MTNAFQFTVTDGWTELRLPGEAGFIPVDLWAIEAPDGALAGVDLVQRLIASSGAITEGDVALIEHASIAALSVREADQIGLPPAAAVIAEVRFEGLITSPGFRVHLGWKRPNGQSIVGSQQVGAWLMFGGGWHRLPDALFAIAEAINQVDAAGDTVSDRLTAIATLREALPTAQADGTAQPQGLAGTLRIAVADSFSLDLKGDGSDAMLEPILHRAGGEVDAPMLDAQQQIAFGEDQFNRFSSARSVYTLPGNTYVVLTPPLRRALDVVRSMQSAPIATKRALLRSPRAFLRDTLGDDVEDAVIESLFRETAVYSDRVLGLGLWEKRVIPWVPLPITNWLGSEAASGTGPASGRPANRGLMIGDRCVPLDVAAIDDLRARVETAIGSGVGAVPLTIDDETIDVPATHETLAAIHALEASDLPKAVRPSSQAAQEVLIIHPNEESVGLEASFHARPAPSLGIPACVITQLKSHQKSGVEWLQTAWMAGSPGVLLADDMGLGKTLQGLSFLAWVRHGMEIGIVERAPVLIVAPTGLLENWIKEHDIHLAAPGLGTCLRAYGRSLAALRRVGPNDVPTLNLDALVAADWVLTTYETLRDHDRDFGLVRFAVILFDEAQKVKNPGVRITDAAKGMNSDFRIAMTGTPVENRLSDLWCIVDGVHPGFLDDLKAFSARYEASHDPEALIGLKRDLERPLAGRPPLLLRRMKYDHLTDLPKHEEFCHETTMPEPQAEAYRAAIENARQADRRGAVLEALQRLRAISLHPGDRGDESDDEFINVSARLIASFKVLDDIHRRGERVLVFVEDLAMQPRLASIVQRRYRLPAPPMLINGQVSGTTRQARVDRFQQAVGGFDVMILSARAGGVGLTLTRANHVIHLSRWWNPAVEDQCTGRVLRIGQTRPVMVHLPLAVLSSGSRSFDQNLQALLERKRNLMQTALIPTEETDGEHREVLDACLSA